MVMVLVDLIFSRVPWTGCPNAEIERQPTKNSTPNHGVMSISSSVRCNSPTRPEDLCSRRRGNPALLAWGEKFSVHMKDAFTSHPCPEGS